MIGRIIGIARGEWTKLTRHRMVYILLALAIILPLSFPVFQGFKEGLAVVETWGSSESAEMPGQIAFCRAAGFSLTLLLPLLLIYASMCITSETENRTLKTMLVRPVRRAEYLIGKSIMMWFFTTVVLAVVFIFSFAVSAIFFNWVDLYSGVELDPAHIAEKTSILGQRLLVMLPLILFAALAFITVALSISTFANGSGTSVGVTMMFFLVGVLVGAFARDGSPALSIIFLNAHCINPLEWALDAAEGYFNQRISASHYLVALAVPAAYVAIFSILSGIVFSRRRIVTS
ncbi:MAG: ABC transporter permease [Planctomycetota bacterium]|jgi:ABC-type transport system involved in multi-copper enzyme maturation permease subunit